MRLILASAFFLFGGIGLAQPQAPPTAPAPPKPGAIGGRVMLAPSVPANACRLTLEGASVSGDCKKGGGFMLTEVPPGQYELQVSVPGIGDTRFSVGTGEGQTTYLGDLSVGIPGAVSGLITAENSSDLDLTVVGIPALSIYTQPNVTGSYLLSGVPGGNWNVTVFAPSQSPTTRAVTATPGQPVRGVDFQIRRLPF
jgi:hypothetical protein